MRALAVLLTITAAGCAGQQRCAERSAAPGTMRLPAFPLEALRGPHALRAKLYFEADGALGKVSIYVSRAGIPDWVHAMADQELGKGEEVEFEVEQYANGDTVYEVTRRVGGKRIELSVRSTDRKKLYLERKDLTLDSLPPPVKQTVAGVAGFTGKEVELKETGDPATSLYEVEGELAGAPVKLCVTPAGKLTATRRGFPAVVQLTR